MSARAVKRGAVPACPPELPVEIWPPPPHDPRDRAAVCVAGAWQVRTLLETDPKLDYLARRGLLHLQLWHPEAQVSVLSPSGLTGGHYETFPINEWKRQTPDRATLARLIRAHHRLELPSAGIMAALESWFVDETVERIVARPEPAIRTPGTIPTTARRQ